DISRLRVGEKLVIKKYSDGADIAVSALNTLITKYISSSEAASNSQSQELNSVGDFTAKDIENLDSLAKSFDTPSEPEPQHQAPQRQAPQPHYQAPKPQQSYQQPQHQAPKPQYQQPKPVEEINSLDDDDDNEKTQIAVSTVAAEANAESVYESLWNDFCNIKRKYGGIIAPAEKTQFINRVKTNRVSIMAKYNCADVQFSIEEKDRKPVVKAKPVFTK
ncbi:hypothetical protein J5834_06325, partial [bacterium]|nr:hypothetical protein [bacterium]